MPTKAQIRKSDTWILNFIKKANSYFRRKFKVPDLSFTLHGIKAGEAELLSNTIRINDELWRYGDPEVESTIGHEVAHCVVYQKFGIVKPHGIEWKAVLSIIGIPNETRCYDKSIKLTSVSKTKKKKDKK